jgi:hypothetical protein
VNRLDENPFDPRPDGVPLRLTLDGRSLSRVEGSAAEEVAFLAELCGSSIVDPLVWGGVLGCASDLPRAVIGELIPEQDAAPVHLHGATVGFIGGVPAWSKIEKRAEALTGRRREHFLYYERAAAFHRFAKRHFFVSDEANRLNAEPGRRRGFPVVNVRTALSLLGWLMRRRGSQNLAGHRGSISNYTAYMLLATSLFVNRLRLAQAHTKTSLLDTSLSELQNSMHYRVIDLLKARDKVAFQNFLPQNNATLDEMLYHLRAALPGAAGLFDSLALSAQTACGIAEEHVGGPVGVSLREREFRSALREHGAPGMADVAGRLMPLLRLVWAFRDPVVHRGSLTGVGYESIPFGGGPESRLETTAQQTEAISETAGLRGEGLDRWGLSGRAGLVDPFVFTSQLCLVCIAAANDMAGALANDLGLPPLNAVGAEFGASNDEMVRLRLVAGVPFP